MDTGGAWWWPNSNAGNLEEWEASLPILYLYRREQINSGGAGRWRGGNGLEVALIPHKTNDLNAQIIACDPAINTSPGLAGGMPGHPGNFMLAEGTSILGSLADGHVPKDRIELEAQIGPLGRLSPKASRALHSGDIFSVEYSGGGGFGDPLLRDPVLVADDVAANRITAESANSMYGVVLGDDDAVDLAGTVALRSQSRLGRLEEAALPVSNGRGKIDAATVKSVSDVLGVYFDDSGDSWWACSECGQQLVHTKENFKIGASLLERNPYAIDPVVYPNPQDFCDVEFVVRQFLCPGCGTVLSTECCRADDEFSLDLHLSADGLRALAER